MRNRVTAVTAAAAASILLGTMFAAPASSQAAEVDAEKVVGGLVSPLSLAVDGDGSVYVSQNFAAMLTRVGPGEDPTVIYGDEAGREVGAVSVAAGEVTFATTGGTRKNPSADLYRMSGEEAPTHVADLFGYEESHNPDGDRRYGMKRLGKSCLSKQPKQLRGVLKAYRGIVESHPYATALGDGVTYVADAAGNSILGVTDAGEVSTVAVLPSTKVKINRKIKRAFGLHKCILGKKMRLEAVPTDVEIGPDGNLYVTSLPGGPEDPVFGANGGVYRIDPATGAWSRIADGLVSPVGLAISPTGTAYISMLFANTILEVPLGGEPSVFAEVRNPGDVEFRNGHVYATKTALMRDPSKPPAGKVLRWNTAPQ